VTPEQFSNVSNAELTTNKQQLLEQQDEKIDSLLHTSDRLTIISRDINDETTLHNKLLD
jgi:hypothetical protein